MLNGYLLASKAYLNSYLKETADQDIKPSPSNAMAALTGLQQLKRTKELANASRLFPPTSRFSAVKESGEPGSKMSQLCHQVENTIIDIINMSVTGV
ncbi:unnamed protein product [Ranitomeya imitator]|uniref:Uncharacterized protein n=1 Tax=Ranitomeya imitator TaxID=111125 RepID=A0ABN9LGX2_9NEOB|nr:unnamed protein product [Ranitomeya imitator]